MNCFRFSFLFRAVATLLLYTLCSAGATWAQSSQEMPPRERHLLAAAFQLAEQVQDSVWAGWSQAPFPVLLVTADREYLVRHPRPSSAFDALGYDERLQDTVYVRPRQFSPTLRATFPAVGGIPTVVIGPPDSSETPAQWISTLLHEHFHQWQMSQPDYYAAVDSLGLAGDDASGQWMLDYPFPYDSTAVQNHFSEMSRQLHAALEAVGTPGLSNAVDRYRRARAAFREVLAADDDRYFSFQIWQEGVARYVAYRSALYVAAQDVHSTSFEGQTGNLSFRDAAEALRRQILHQLRDLSLQDGRRRALYSVGAAEALLLDHVNPTWHRQYWAQKFALERYYGLK